MINLYSEDSLVIEGVLSAKGANSEKVDYTSFAAGAGGSIKLSGSTISLIPS